MHAEITPNDRHAGSRQLELKNFVEPQRLGTKPVEMQEERQEQQHEHNPTPQFAPVN
jgi:hypothetical protein